MSEAKVVWKVPRGYKVLEDESFIPAQCLIPFGGLESFTSDDFRTRNSDIPIVGKNERIEPLGYAQKYADYMEADFYEIVNKPIHQPLEWKDDLKIQLYIINPCGKVYQSKRK